MTIDGGVGEGDLGNVLHGFGHRGIQGQREAYLLRVDQWSRQPKHKIGGHHVLGIIDVGHQGIEPDVRVDK